MGLKTALRLTAALGLVLAVQTTVSPVHASQVASAVYDAPIPPMALSAALNIFAQNTGLQLAYITEVANGLQTEGAPAGLSREATLERLLAGTGLSFRFVNDNTVTIVEGGEKRRRPFIKTAADAPAQRPAKAAPASAVEAPQAAGAFEEIIVNARRRDESLQSVPIAVSVVTQEKLSESNIQSVGDMQHYVPSLTMFGPFRNTPLVSIRGQGGFTPGGIPSVIIYMNEVPSPTSAQAGSPGGALGGNGLFFDLESVQVLKGPQGTLFGRNTTGGAVLLQSRRPREDLGARLQVTAGNYKDREIDGAVNLPLLDDKLLARVAFNGQRRDGFTKVQSTPNAPNGKDLDDANHFSTRLSVLARPADGVENLVIADYINSKTNGTSAILSAVNPSPQSSVNKFFPGAAALLVQQQALGIRKQVPLGVDMFSSQNRWSVTDIFTWKFADNITLRNIASASRAKYAQTIDGDGTAFPIFDPIAAQDIPYVTRQYTEELQMQGKSFDDVLNWTVGFFYLKQPEENKFTRHINKVLGGSRTIGFKQSEDTQAVFAQTDTDLSRVVDGLSLTTGIRYTWETISRVNRDVRASGACTSPYADANCVLQGSKNFGAPTWTVSLNYQATPDTLVYAASHRGFRSGGFNLVGDALAVDRSYDQEYVTDIELGAKSEVTFGNIGIRNNVALYRQYYSDIQLSQVSVSAITGGPLTITKNAGTAWITGFEAESRISFNKALEVGGHFSWIDYRFKKLDPTVVLPLLVTNIPEFKFGIDATYNLPIDSSLGDFSVTANWNWQDSVYLSTINDPLSRQKPYGLLTLGAAWRNVAQYPVDVSFFMNNALNQDYAIGALPFAGSVGTSTLAYGAPRMWGFRLAYRFGSEE